MLSLVYASSLFTPLLCLRLFVCLFSNIKMPRIYIKYENNSPVPIDISYGRGPGGNLPLEVVGDLIAAYKTAVAPLLDEFSLAQLTLHLPDGAARAVLDEDCFANIDETDTSLDPGCLISALGSLGSKSKKPLIIKSNRSRFF